MFPFYTLWKHQKAYGSVVFYEVCHKQSLEFVGQIYKILVLKPEKLSDFLTAISMIILELELKSIRQIMFKKYFAIWWSR